MNQFKLAYNPYKKATKFYEFKNNCWKEPDSHFFELNKFENKVIQNCADSLIFEIDKCYNENSQGLVITFEGTQKDMSDFENSVNVYNKKKNKIIQVEFKETCISADDAINKLKECFEKLRKEFDDCIPEAKGYAALDDDLKKIGEHVYRFNDAIKSEVVACVIGNYSVGKSTFINAILGDEYLPSDIDPATARIVRISDSKNIELDLTIISESKKEPINISWYNNKVIYNSPNGCYKYVDLIKKIINAKEDVVSQVRNLLAFFNSSTNNEKEFFDNIKFDYINDDGLSSKDFFDLNKIIDEKIKLCVPFANIRISNQELQLVLIDTPGSNSKKHKETHTKILEDALNKQTNSIPIYLIKRDAVYSTDNDDLKCIVEPIEGIDPNRGIYIISMADESIPEDCAEPIPSELVKNGMEKWLYVSQLMGLCSNKNIIYDSKLKAKYKKNRSAFDESNEDKETLLQLYKYAVLPLSEKESINSIAESSKTDVNKTIYVNSGFTALDYEINKFASTQALYFKVEKSREYLLKALKMLEEKLGKEKDNLEQDKKNHIKEKETKFNKLKIELDNIVSCYNENNRKGFKQRVIRVIRNDITKAETKLCDDEIKNIVNQYDSLFKQKETHDNIIRDLNDKINEVSKDLCDIFNLFKSTEVEKARNEAVTIITTDTALTNKSKNLIKTKIEEQSNPSIPKISISYDQMKEKGASLKKFIFLDNSDNYISEIKKIIANQRNSMRDEYINRTANNILDALKALNDMLRSCANDTSIELLEFQKKLNDDEKRIEGIKNRINNLSGVKKNLQSLCESEEVL